MPNCEIICIGDELIIGQIINTNASWLSENLDKLGINISKQTTIRDNASDIKSSLNNAINNNEIVIITGGLGPTKDDITKKCLCEFFDDNLILNNSVLEQIKLLFDNRGFELTEINRQQAFVPSKAIVLPNKNGTAPGMLFKHKNKLIFSLPGVPYEMKALFDNSISAIITQEYNLMQDQHHHIMIQGIGESFLSDKIQNWENNLPEYIKLAYLPSPGIINLRMTAMVDFDCKDEFESLENELRKIIPNLIYANKLISIEKAIADIFIENKLSLSVAESCTGGLISHKITSLAGSSQWYYGGVCAYDNSIKSNVLNIDNTIIEKYGAVSREIVELMAINVKKIMNTNYSVATSGIAGPSGGSKEKPVGTVWIAIAGPNDLIISKKFLFGEHRGRNIEKSYKAALNLLRLSL